jgi:apolipoprotein N-acyltransferase
MPHFLSYSTFKLATAGIMTTLAFEPLGLQIFLLPSFLILLDNVFRKPAKQAFLNGLIFGFFHFISSLYWIGIALTSNIGNFLWLMPFVIILIPLVLGLYTGIVCLIANFCDSNRLWFYLNFCLTWTFFEYIRGYIPLAFPWNFMGYILASNDYTVRLAPWLGVHLSSFLVLLLSALVFTKRLSLIIPVYLLFILSITMLGQSQGPNDIEFWPEKIRIVQPNLADHHLGNPDHQLKVISTLVELSITGNRDNLKAILWPEAAYPYLFRGKPQELHALSSLAPKDGYLIIGADRIDNEGHIYNSLIAISSNAKIALSSLAPKDGYLTIGADRIDNEGHIYNSPIAISTNAEIASTYDKYALVPFGEYVPLRNILTFVDKIAYGIGEFTPGKLYTGASSNNIVLSYYPLICYEVIFPIKQDLKNYNWLLNITNDAWFGVSSGPYQHLAMAKFVASEYGLPLVRVANTGVSALISPYGKVMEKLDLNTRGFLDIQLPKKSNPTYTTLRNNQILLISICFFICLFLNLALKISTIFNKRAK